MKRAVITSILFLLFMFIGMEAFAQCPMCRMAAESNLENGGSAGKGLNNGILYMLAMPYLIICLLGFIWYKNRKTEETEDATSPVVE